MEIATLRLWSTRVWAFIKLGRFVFLTGGVVVYGLGVAMALYSGATIHWRVAIWGQLIVTATQLMVHYSNDYYDFEADQNNRTFTVWSGGSRVLQAGLLPRWIARVAAIFLAMIAVIGVLLLAVIEQPGALTVPIVLVAVVIAWEYSSPPLKLHARGIGELCSVFVVSVLTPVLSIYLQMGKIVVLPLLAILPIACLQFNMLLSVDMPDLEGDAATNKRTLVVRIGRVSSARLYLIMLVLAYALLPILVIIGLPSLVALCFGLTFPLALWLFWRVSKGDWLRPAQWSSLQFLSIALLMSATILELIAFVALAIGGS